MRASGRTGSLPPKRIAGATSGSSRFAAAAGGAPLSFGSTYQTFFHRPVIRLRPAPLLRTRPLATTTSGNFASRLARMRNSGERSRYGCSRPHPVPVRRARKYYENGVGVSCLWGRNFTVHLPKHCGGLPRKLLVDWELPRRSEPLKRI